MNKKHISLFLTFILISTTLLSCKGSNVFNISTEQKAHQPYYSITNEYINQEKSNYMELDIRIPKITYSGIESDQFIDSINEEIYTMLTDLISNAKTKALETYESYIKTARNNIKNEFDAKLKEIDDKYSNVFENTDINGFTGTNVIIDPNLHNKNIIVIEKKVETENATESNIADSASKSNTNKYDIKESKKRDLNANGLETSYEIKNRNMIATDTQIDNTPETTKKKKNSIKLASLSEIDQTLTIDDYYKDLAKTNRTTLPSDRDLLKEYTPTKIICNYDVKCLNDDYISFLIEFNNMKTAPSIERFFYNIDLHNKKLLTIENMFGENYKTLCINAITSSIEKMSSEEKSKLKTDYNLDEYINDKLEFFINNNNTPVIILDKFTLTSSYLEFPIVK